MQLELLIVLGMALATAAVPAQCAWNGYTLKNFGGQVTKSQSVVSICNQITNPALLNDLKSAKVILGTTVCLFESTTGCSGSGLMNLQVDSSGPRSIGSQTYHHWKCGPCLAG